MQAKRRGVVVSHWDVDGVVAAALVVRHLGYTYLLATPVSIASMVREALHHEPSHIVLCDVGPAPTTHARLESLLRAFTSSGGRVTVIDHHEWPQNLLSIPGVEPIVDRSAEAASLLVYKWLESLGVELDDHDKLLTAMAVDDELFTNTMEEAMMWRRMLRWYDWSFRYRAVEALASGEIMPGWAREAYREMEEEYRRTLMKVVEGAQLVVIRGLNIVILDARWKPADKIHPGEIHQAAEEKYGGMDMYVIVYPSGFSLRSRRIDVGALAKRLGGGGHPKAAGVPKRVGDIDELVAMLSLAL